MKSKTWLILLFEVCIKNIIRQFIVCVFVCFVLSIS